MRKKQSEAACTVLRRQHAFLKAGTLPDMTAPDTRTAPVGDVQAGLDEQSLDVLEIKPDGAEDDPGTHGQMRIRRRITYAKPGRGQPVTRTVFFSTRTDIFNVNSLCEKWVRVRCCTIARGCRVCPATPPAYRSWSSPAALPVCACAVR